MSNDEKPTGGSASKLAVEPADGGEGDRGRSDTSPPRGLRSQPPALRILLIASLAALAIGVVRCSIELTTVSSPISSIGVERALVDLDESGAWAPADSVAARAARLFAGALREAGSVDVRIAPPGAAGFDAIARLRVSGSDGRIRVAVGIVDASSGRALLQTGGEGVPDMLGGLLDAAAVHIASELGISKSDREDGGAAGEGSGGA